MKTASISPSMAACSPGIRTAAIPWVLWFGMFSIAIGIVSVASAQEAESETANEAISGKSDDSSVDDTLNAAEADDSIETKGQGPKWNEYDGRYFTLRGGFGLLFDSASYIQDANSKEQMPQSTDVILRDFRLLLKGRFKFAPRLSYTLGYMYDGAEETWRFRQTGIMIDVPEWSGRIFVGRTKEGFSTNKLSVGYNLWTNERAAVNEAFLPILADGVKWIGNGFAGKLTYNVGWFTNIEPQQRYVKNDQVVAARAVWLPFAKTENKNALHLALEGRYGSSKSGKLQYRSKPESYAAQKYAVDTGEFQAGSSTMGGFEAYYRQGAWMFGTEYFLNKVSSSETGNPFFHGGEIFTAYLLTGEIRPYNERGGFFEMIKPARPVFSGGPGAWELVLRYSYVDLDSGTLQGGKFQRITPMVNWHLTENMRLEFVYGYSILDRFGITGHTQYFQSRLQLQL